MVLFHSSRKGLSILALAAFAFGAVGSSKKNDENAAATKVVSRVPAAGAGTAVNAKIGDTVTFDDATWVVVEAKDAGKTVKANDGFTPPLKSEGKFVFVHFKVTNRGNKEERVFDGPRMHDSKGREFKAHDHEYSFIPPNAKAMTLEALPPSIAREFWSLYEVADDSTDLRFGARELAFAGIEKPIALGF